MAYLRGEEVCEGEVKTMKTPPVIILGFSPIFIDVTSKQNASNNQEPSATYDKLYTYEDYLRFDFEHMVELIKGRLYKMSSAPHPRHQEVSVKLTRFIDLYLDGKACQLFHAPFDVILPIENKKKVHAASTVVQPDLCVICDRSKITDQGCIGAPDLVIEILSPSTAKKDMTDKYEIYEEAGVKEYWIVSSKDNYVQVFVLQDGQYGRPQVFIDKETVSPLMFPDLEIDLSKVFGG